MALRLKLTLAAFVLLGTSSASTMIIRPLVSLADVPEPITTNMQGNSISDAMADGDLSDVSDRGFVRHLHNRLPRYRQWFEEAANQSSQDWQLLAAMGYQESKWNPKATSSQGAIGLMQLTQKSAGESRVTNLTDAHESIMGGARYFQRMYKTIPTHVPEPDRTWLALAAYNIGYGHLEDARILAQKAGRNPDSWTDVSEFLPLLSQEHWYAQTANGYARGSEPVHYVEGVRSYRDLLDRISTDVSLN